MIYFISDAISGYVKIGLSEDPWKRIAKIQSDCPGELSVLSIIDGGEAEEAALHARFGNCRIRGEWFRPDSALADHIATLPPAIHPRHSRRTAGGAAGIVDRLGGHLAVADLLGIARSTVQRWTYAPPRGTGNRVPQKYWADLVVKSDGLVSFDDLVADVRARLAALEAA